MLTAFSFYQEDNPKPIKLSRIHRRVFPLSLFPAYPESPQSLFTPNRTQNLPQFSHKKVKKPHPYTPFVPKPRTQSTIVPRIDYRHIKETSSPIEITTSHYFYQPCSLKVSPRSKVVVYSASPLGVQTVKKVKKRVKAKEKRVAEIFEEKKQPLKLRRITSSKITFPSVNIGQVMLRVKDLVLDPLKREIAEYNRRNK